MEFINTPAKTTFELEVVLYKTKHQDLIRHLSGEMERMLKYPTLGFIAAIEIPYDILTAYEIIKVIAPKYN